MKTLLWKKWIRLCCCGTAAVFLSGCASRYKMPFYSSNDRMKSICEIGKVEYPFICEIQDIKEVHDWHLRGYEVIGGACFRDRWLPRTYAIDLARQHGASVILVCYKFDGEKNEIITSTTPHHHANFTTGMVTDNSGQSSMYTAAVHSTSYSTSISSYTRKFYQQNIYFLARRRQTNDYGVYFVPPPNIPGKVACDKVIVDFVFEGAKAEKAGIRPGDLVISINGMPLKDFAEARMYMNGEKKIESMVVRHD